MWQRSTLRSARAPTPPCAMPARPAGPMARGSLQTSRGPAVASFANSTVRAVSSEVSNPKLFTQPRSGLRNCHRETNSASSAGSSMCCPRIRRLSLYGWKTGHGSVRRIVQTLRMAEAASAVADAALAVGGLTRTPGAISVRRDVEDDVVGMGRIGHTLDALQLVEAESISHPPRHHVIRAGGVAADAHAADLGSVAVERQPAAEDIHAADALADHRIVRRAER